MQPFLERWSSKEFSSVITLRIPRKKNLIDLYHGPFNRKFFLIESKCLKSVARSESNEDTNIVMSKIIVSPQGADRLRLVGAE